MNWEDAGQAWGARSAEWAYLFEPFARKANGVLFEALDVGPGVQFLDVACGSGLAAQGAGGLGAVVSGLDAAEALVAIARLRSPSADFRVGDMCALPFPDASFDCVTSFNGIWKGCDAALVEARRVLVPGGRLGLTFWGRYERLGLMPYFLKVIELSPPSHGEANMRNGDTGRPGVIEEMLARAGFVLGQRGTVDAVNEWPDVEIAIRALAAAGPSVPAIREVGIEAFCEALRDFVEPLYEPGVGVRVTSELGWVTATSAES